MGAKRPIQRAHANHPIIRNGLDMLSEHQEVRPMVHRTVKPQKPSFVAKMFNPMANLGCQPCTSDHLDSNQLVQDMDMTADRNSKRIEDLERALGITRAKHGPKSVQVGYVLTQLANAHVAFGQVNKQKDLLKHAIEIFEHECSKENTQVSEITIGKTLIDLSSAYQEFDEMKEKKRLLERAICIYERCYGPNQPQVAEPLVELGATHGRLGEWWQQKELLERALRIEEDEFGPHSLKVASTRVKLGDAHGELGNPQRRVELLEAALDVLICEHGPNHSEVGTTLTSLGNAHGDLGNALKQKELLEQSLLIKERLYGLHHPEVAVSLASLSNAYGNLKEVKEQKELMERALRINIHEYGPDHSKVASTLVSMGNIYLTLGDPTQAMDFFGQAHCINERAYGPNHPQIAQILVNLGNAHGALGNTIEQREFLQRACAIYERKYGVDHPYTSRARVALNSVSHDKRSLPPHRHGGHKANSTRQPMALLGDDELPDSEPEYLPEQILPSEKLKSKQGKDLNGNHDNDDTIFVVPAPEQEPAPEEEPDNQIKQAEPTPQHKLLGGRTSAVLAAMPPLMVEEVMSEDLKKQSCLPETPSCLPETPLLSVPCFTATGAHNVVEQVLEDPVPPAEELVKINRDGDVEKQSKMHFPLPSSREPAGTVKLADGKKQSAVSPTQKSMVSAIQIDVKRHARVPLAEELVDKTTPSDVQESTHLSSASLLAAPILMTDVTQSGARLTSQSPKNTVTQRDQQNSAQVPIAPLPLTREPLTLTTTSEVQQHSHFSKTHEPINIATQPDVQESSSPFRRGRATSGTNTDVNTPFHVPTNGESLDSTPHRDVQTPFLLPTATLLSERDPEPYATRQEDVKKPVQLSMTEEKVKIDTRYGDQKPMDLSTTPLLPTQVPLTSLAQNDTKKRSQTPTAPMSPVGSLVSATPQGDVNRQEPSIAGGESDPKKQAELPPALMLPRTRTTSSLRTTSSMRKRRPEREFEKISFA